MSYVDSLLLNRAENHVRALQMEVSRLTRDNACLNAILDDIECWARDTTDEIEEGTPTLFVLGYRYAEARQRLSRGIQQMINFFRSRP